MTTSLVFHLLTADSFPHTHSGTDCLCGPAVQVADGGWLIVTHRAIGSAA